MTFNPNEARDPKGKWTAGSGTYAEEKQRLREARNKPYEDAAKQYEQNVLDESAQQTKLAADKVAADLGYDPNLISVRTDDMKFQLNGATYDYAGAAHLDTGKIELFAKHVTPASVGEVTSHEIGHQWFQTFINDYQAEYKQMTEATKDIDVDTFMKPNGLLKEGWAEKFPLYQKYTEVMMPSVTEEFSVSDGITDYSRKWWDAWKAGKAQTDQAFHETIAEMTAREYMAPVDNETEGPKFKDAGYSLDTSYGRYKEPSKYSVRQWKGGPIDESTLPQHLKDSLKRLRDRAEYESRLLNPLDATRKYGEPAKEWVGLYDAIKAHWNSKQKVAA